jgi:uncharacterized protein (TIGR02594 family)
MSAMLPLQYRWLNNEPGPKLLKAGLSLYGIKETPGKASNPVIMDWASKLGISYAADEVAWCGLFMAYCVHMTGRKPVDQPLWARNWAKWGKPASVAMLGDVLVFSRETGGHVGIYVGEDPVCYHVLGGNQGDAVSIVRIDKMRTIAIRRPEYINQPVNVRVVRLSTAGIISNNES